MPPPALFRPSLTPFAQRVATGAGAVEGGMVVEVTPHEHATLVREAARDTRVCKNAQNTGWQQS